MSNASCDDALTKTLSVEEVLELADADIAGAAKEVGLSSLARRPCCGARAPSHSRAPRARADDTQAPPSP